MGMSKYTRYKLKAHDRGEDRHNKGLALLKKWSRLRSEHQAALQAAAERRHAERKVAVTNQARAKRRKEFAAARREESAQQQFTQNLFEAAGVDPGLLMAEPEPEPVRTYRVRRVDSEEASTVQGIVVVKPMKLNW